MKAIDNLLLSFVSDLDADRSGHWHERNVWPPLVLVRSPSTFEMKINFHYPLDLSWLSQY